MVARRQGLPHTLRGDSLQSRSLRRILVRFWLAILALVFAACGGAAFMRATFEPQPSWDDALYMTLITISTVGYGETVPLDTFGERFFAGMLAIAGFGILTFLFTSLTMFFFEGDLDATLRRRRMEKEIEKLKRHYVICGYGRVGRNIARELAESGERFVAIDSNAARFEGEDAPGLFLVGDASDDDLLAAADIADAAGVFAVTGDDSRNLMITLTARHLNPALRVVARCHEVRNIPKLEKAGADAIVSPDASGALGMAQAMLRPNVLSMLDEMVRADRPVRSEELRLPEDFRPRRLAGLRQAGDDFLLLAVRAEGEWVFNPADDFELRPGQELVLMGRRPGVAPWPGDSAWAVDVQLLTYFSVRSRMAARVPSRFSVQ